MLKFYLNTRKLQHEKESGQRLWHCLADKIPFLQQLHSDFVGGWGKESGHGVNVVLNNRYREKNVENLYVFDEIEPRKCAGVMRAAIRMWDLRPGRTADVHHAPQVARLLNRTSTSARWPSIAASI